MKGLVVYCADVGSIPEDNFGWARGKVETPRETPRGGGSIDDLAREVKNDLAKNVPVALGFECPIFAPLRDEPEKLSEARNGEGKYPWSAGAGASSLATGLAQIPWILRNIKPDPPVSPEPFLDWEAFSCSGRGLFLWEAFVSGDAKADKGTTTSHEKDAAIAVQCFIDHVGDLPSGNAIREDKVFSLLGAALLRTDWSRDLALLAQSSLVLKAAPPS